MQFIDVLSTLSFIHSWDQCTLRWWLMMRPPKVLGNPLSAMNRTSAVFLIWGSPHPFFLDICVPPGDEIKKNSNFSCMFINPNIFFQFEF